jgi:ATP adenylyltransferase
MKPLWAPWRMSWILGEKPKSCIFCEYPPQGPSLDTLTLHVGERAFVVLNRYPYTNGHVMVVPRTHVSRLVDLDEPTFFETAGLLRTTAQALHDTLSPEGLNIGLNQGAAAGAGIAAHLHWHLVPRWTGDSSFLSVVSDVRVISQAIEDTWRLLRPRFEQREQGKA